MVHASSATLEGGEVEFVSRGRRSFLVQSIYKLLL